MILPGGIATGLICGGGGPLDQRSPGAIAQPVSVPG